MGRSRERRSRGFSFREFSEEEARQVPPVVRCVAEGVLGPLRAAEEQLRLAFPRKAECPVKLDRAIDRVRARVAALHLARAHRRLDLAGALASIPQCGGAMEGAQVAAGGFVDTLKEEDRAMVIDFDEKVFLLQDLTGDKEGLKLSINSTYPQGGTAIYDALYAAFRILNENEGRKAIILLTDGDDHNSHFTLERVMKTARSSEVVIYSIGLGSGVKRGPLRDLAVETGGRSYFPGNVEQLRDVYAQVAQELRSQYYLTYSSTNKEFDGKYRKIKLKSNREDVEIHTRRGYYATKTTKIDPEAGIILSTLGPLAQYAGPRRGQIPCRG